MKRYFKNLWQALTGKDPYQDDLDEKDRQLEHAAENVRVLHKTYYDALVLQGTTNKELGSLQMLVENLRERIKEKDAELDQLGREYLQQIGQIRQEYEKRIATYAREIAKLQKQ